MAGTVESKLIFQAFEWYSSGDDGSYWLHLKELLPKLKKLGFDLMWIPPGCKASGKHSNGYDVYDLYDLGEFDQKGTRSTKWGSKEELLELTSAANENGIGILWDAVIGHRGAADFKQKCQAVKVDDEDRNRQIGNLREIEAWVGYDFPGRGDKYSTIKYDANQFNGVDYDAKTGEKAIFKMIGSGDKDWAQDVDEEKGNYDFLLCSNVDLSREDVRQDLFHWVNWIGKELNLQGLRIDAIRHMSRGFIKDFVEQCPRDWFIVGEYATPSLKSLVDYVDFMGPRMFLFDFTLHGNFVGISNDTRADLRKIYNGSLLKERSHQTVTFVTNHDTQRDQPAMARNFVPMAYALILLSDRTRYPCVFYGDLFGTRDPHTPNLKSHCTTIAKILMVRRLFAHGEQQDYLDDPNCIGFTRAGAPQQSSGAELAVIMANGYRTTWKRMNIGLLHAQETWVDVIDASLGPVVVRNDGWAMFPAKPRSVGVWVSSIAADREELNNLAS